MFLGNIRVRVEWRAESEAVSNIRITLNCLQERFVANILVK
jgi:hypothetical protein